ncbi:MAG: PstS family phosphate ABC transporter substrate-binding protein [Prochlorococcaceae cyanobacterium]|jgi:phosphate transport system substrate-binding protein
MLTRLLSRTALVLGTLVGASLLAQGLKAQTGPASIAISGSSTVAPITELALKGFQATAAGRGASIGPVVENGTSAGFRDFCAGRTSISNASRPINAKELKACETAGIRFYELPIAFDAITVVVNPANTWVRSMSIADLKRLWNPAAQGKVNRWNQVRSDWPDKPIRLFGPGKDSGTFDYFNKAVNGDSDESRTDYVASEDDNLLVKGVAGDDNALGYFGFAYFKANQGKLRAVAISSPRGAILPSLQSVQDEVYQPLARPVFIYVNEKAYTSSPLLRAFVNHTFTNAPQIVAKEGSVPLSNRQYDLVKTKLLRQVSGSAFSGDLPVGMTLGQLLNRSIDQIKRPEFRS